jgi:hypothetical protein
MMDKVYNILKQKAIMSNIFIVIIIQTIFQLIIVLHISPELSRYSSESILDLRMYYTQNEIITYFNQLGTEGRETYFYLIFLDLVYPFAYTSTFLLLYVYLGVKTGINEKILKNIFFLPFLLFLSDLIENTGSFIILKNFPREIFILKMQGYFTLVKQILLTVNLLTIGLTGLIALKNQLFLKK